MSEKLLWAVKTITNTDFHARPRMIRYIANKYGVECKPIFDNALNDDNPKTRIAALEVYKQLFPDETLGVAEQLVNDKNWLVRRRAKKILKLTSLHHNTD